MIKSITFFAMQIRVIFALPSLVPPPLVPSAAAPVAYPSIQNWTWLLKRLLPLLSTTLTQICNASFHEGVFPANLKEAIVILG